MTVTVPNPAEPLGPEVATRLPSPLDTIYRGHTEQIGYPLSFLTRFLLMEYLETNNLIPSGELLPRRGYFGENEEIEVLEIAVTEAEARAQAKAAPEIGQGG